MIRPTKDIKNKASIIVYRKLEAVIKISFKLSYS